MKQKMRWSVTITKADRENMFALERAYGKPYGVFFDTSGKAHIEQVNPTAQYNYVWRTDLAKQPEAK